MGCEGSRECSCSHSLGNWDNWESIDTPEDSRGTWTGVPRWLEGSPWAPLAQPVPVQPVGWQRASWWWVGALSASWAVPSGWTPRPTGGTEPMQRRLPRRPSWFYSGSIRKTFGQHQRNKIFPQLVRGYFNSAAKKILIFFLWDIRRDYPVVSPANSSSWSPAESFKRYIHLEANLNQRHSISSHLLAQRWPGQVISDYTWKPQPMIYRKSGLEIWRDWSKLYITFLLTLMEDLDRIDWFG